MGEGSRQKRSSRYRRLGHLLAFLCAAAVCCLAILLIAGYPELNFTRIATHINSLNALEVEALLPSDYAPQGLVQAESKKPASVIDTSDTGKATGVVHKQSSKPVVMLKDNVKLRCDMSKLNDGLIHINLKGAKSEEYRVFLRNKDVVSDEEINDKTKRGLMWRTYKSGYYPLISGSGLYELIIYKKIDQKRSAVLHSLEFEAYFDEVEPFLYTNVFADYDNQSHIAKKARLLADACASNEEKIQVIARFCEIAISYDSGLVGVYVGGIGNVDATYTSAKGVCHHYSTLFVAMCRSIGIPAKEVHGYYANVSRYHSWNEVYLDGEWLVVDSMHHKILLDKDGSGYVPDSFTDR